MQITQIDVRATEEARISTGANERVLTDLEYPKEGELILVTADPTALKDKGIAILDNLVLTPSLNIQNVNTRLGYAKDVQILPGDIVAQGLIVSSQEPATESEPKSEPQPAPVEEAEAAPTEVSSEDTNPQVSDETILPASVPEQENDQQ